MTSESAQAKFKDCAQEAADPVRAQQMYARLADLDLAAPATSWL
jgi:hypothetical protein